MGVVDPDFFGNVFHSGKALDESFGMQVIEGFERSGAGFNDFLVSVIMNIFRGYHGDAGMMVFGVVPGKEFPAEGASIFD